MKVCPKCDRDYADEAGFCLIDGTPLVDGDVMPTVAIRSSAEPTLVLPATATEKKRSKIPLIIAGVLGMVILLSVSAYLLSKTSQKGNEVRENQNLRKQAASQAPTKTPTQQPAS
ncbi:MAG: hypothetical protein IPG58_18120 [Acidobacteria bacterium]|nr:hypothetical protein [Acidobacteriota bacterium]